MTTDNDTPILGFKDSTVRSFVLRTQSSLEIRVYHGIGRVNGTGESRGCTIRLNIPEKGGLKTSYEHTKKELKTAKTQDEYIIHNQYM